MDASHQELKREQLYERVWSTPATQLAAEFGISDVALAKRCKKMLVPRPPRGYWARVAAGQSPPRKPLPIDPDAPTVALNEKIPALTLPANNRKLLPAAVELAETLHAATPRDGGFVQCALPTLPRVSITEKLIDRAARSLHVIIESCKPRGIVFRRASSKYDPAYFARNNDRVHFRIEERMETVTRPVTKQDLRHPSSEWRLSSQRLSGRLSFIVGELDRDPRHSGRCWTESESLPIEKTLGDVVEGICQYYINLDKEHAEWEEQRRKELAQMEAEEREKELQKHDHKLRRIAFGRDFDLIMAAEWHRIQNSVLHFVEECERRWQSAQPDGLTPEQLSWLSWARERSRALSPFEAGYPDPSSDGSFDAAKVAVGGPYPSNRNFRRPPSMPEIPPPAEQQGGVQRYDAPATQYPYWLKHQGR